MPVRLRMLMLRKKGLSQPKEDFSGGCQGEE